MAHQLLEKKNLTWQRYSTGYESSLIATQKEAFKQET